jgi:hypothetical protein
MVDLKTLVENQKWNGMSDIQVIMTFLDMNNMEEEAMELIHELTKSKIEKLKHERRIVREWFDILPSKYLYENYDLDTADMLHTLELDYLAHGCELSNSRLKWAKENIPNIKMPKVYFRPLIEYMESKDIRFKGK